MIKKCWIFALKFSELLNPFQNNSKNVLFRKSALACPKIVGSGPPAPRSKVLECALLLRCWPSRSRADRPSYRSAKVSTYWRDTLYISFWDIFKALKVNVKIVKGLSSFGKRFCNWKEDSLGWQNWMHFLFPSSTSLTTDCTTIRACAVSVRIGDTNWPW